ncbi:MAG: hypothetical protein ACOH2N_12325 [Devosia sp.]
MSEDSKESVFRALGAPVLAGFPEELRLTKRNLLFVAAAVIFVKMSGMKIGQENVSLLGLSFSNPGQIWLDLMLLGTILYLFAQFSWQTVDYAMQTRLRVTGTELSWVTVGMSAYDGADYPADPQQSTLYFWWRDEAKKIGKMGDLVEEVKRAANSVKNATKDFDRSSTSHFAHLVRKADELNTTASKLGKQFSEAEKALSSERIPISLERFDKWFWSFKRSQVWRTLLMDILLPVVMAAVAVGSIGVPYAIEHWPW